MEEANKDTEELKKYGRELWLLFDDMHIRLSLSLLAKIFIYRKYDGKKVSNNIKLIGACNHYWKRKENKEKCGLSMNDDNKNELVFLVQPFLQSLLYYVFSFGNINELDEKKYIYSILEKSFSEEEKYLHELYGFWREFRIKNYKDYNKNNSTFKKPDIDKNSYRSILKETYTFRDYNKEEFPFYKYFYYTDYLDQNYINKQLSHVDETRNPVLKSYLDFKRNKNEKNKVYSLTNLNLFNGVLNLINENNYKKISRGYAEKMKFKTEKLYNENKLLIDKFINFVNDIISKEGKSIKLNIENPFIIMRK